MLSHKEKGLFMPQITEVRNHNLGFDIVHAPHGYGLWDGISFKGVGGGWLNPASYINHQEHAKLFLREFSLKKSNASVAEHWLGYSGSSYFPVTAGHTYLVTGEFRNAGAACSTSNLDFYSGSHGSSLNFPGGANQTAYTRIWHTFEASYSRFYVHLYPAVAGTTIQLDIRNLRYFDVTDVDPVYYEAIARLDYYAIRTSLEAIKLRTMPGITRKGNLISLDTTTNADEVAAGTPYKAVTANALKTYITNSANYVIRDNNNNVVVPKNLAKDYLTIPMVNTSGSQNGQSAVWDNVRSNWGTVKGTEGATIVNVGLYFTTSYTKAWITDNQSSQAGTYIFAFDFMDETDAPHTTGTLFFWNTTHSQIPGVPNYTTERHKWVRLAAYATLSEDQNWSIDGCISGIKVGQPYRYSFKNLAFYNVTNIPSSYWPAIAKGQFSLLQAESPVQLTGNTISYQKASVPDVIGGTTNKNYIVDANTLCRSINFGRVRDVTSGPLGFGGWTQVSFNGGSSWQTLSLDYLNSVQYDHAWRGSFSLRNTSSTTGEHWLGFSQPVYGLAFPAEEGHSYLMLADVRNSGAAILNRGAINPVLPSGMPNVAAGYILPTTASQTAYTRLYATFGYSTQAYYNGRVFLDIYPNVSGQVVQVDVVGWKHFDITGMNTNDIRYLATLPMTQLDDIYFRYLVHQNSVSPWQDIIDLGSSADVSLEAGRAYKLIATSGTHTIRTITIPAGVRGEDTHITITTSQSGTVQFASPIVVLGKLLPSAVNDCTVKFVDGKAQFYVDKASAGYVVVYSDGVDDGSLFYGIARNNNGLLEYITFADIVNNVQIYSTAVSTTKPIVVVGNGKGTTDISFRGNSLNVPQGMTVNTATLRDVTVTGGMISLNDTKLAGVIRLSGGSITFEKYTVLDADIIGSAIAIVSGSSISGTGTINLTTSRIDSSGVVSFNGITINGSSFTGSSIRGSDNTVLTMTNCIMQNNINTSSNSLCGGALYLRKANARNTITQSIFRNNYASDGSNFGIGGAIYVTNNSYLDISNCLIEGNTCKTNGYGGGITLAYGATVCINACTILGNTAYYGSGISHGVVNVTGSLTVENSEILNGVGGPGIWSGLGGPIIIKNCTISGHNHNANLGGGISTITGGAAITSGFSMTIENCTISNNSALVWAGGGVYLNTSSTSGYTILIKNCVFFNNYVPNTYGGGGLYANNVTVVTVDGCTFYDNTPDAVCVQDSAKIILRNCIIFDDITIATRVSSGSGCISIEGTLVFTGQFITNPLGCRVEIASGSVIDLSNNPNKNCIIGGTISATGQFRVVNINNEPCDHLARSVTGSTITNEGKWLPSVTRIVVPENTTASFRGYELNNDNVGYGGSVYMAKSNCDVEFVNCDMSHNIAANYAGAIYIASSLTNVNVKVTDCTITGNSAGLMTIACYSGNIQVTNCIVTGNTSNDVGNAIYVTNTGVATVTNCYFAENKGVNGVAIYTSYGGQLTVIGTTITNNIATNGVGTAIGLNGNTKQTYQDCIIDGTIVGMGGVGNTTILELKGYNKFTGTMTGTLTLRVDLTDNPYIDLMGNTNSIAIRGGTISSNSNVIIKDKDGNFHKYQARSVTGSTITNTGLWLPAPGRLVITTAGNYEVEGYTISNLTHTSHGAAAYITAGTVYINDIVFDNNSITASGALWGASIYVNGSNTKCYIDGCTFSNNSAPYAGGVFVDQSCHTYVTNSIFVNNKAETYGGAVYAYRSAFIQLENCDISGSSAANYAAIQIQQSTASMIGCKIHDNIGPQPRGMKLWDASAVVNLSGCEFTTDQNIDVVGTLTLSGNNTIMSAVSGTGTISIAANAIINLIENPITNAITCSTITAAGEFYIIDKDGNYRQYFARTVTGSTITNDGRWYPAFRITITDGSTKSYTGTIVTGNSQTAQSGGGIYISSGSINFTGGTVSSNTLYNSTSVFGGGLCVTGSASTANLTNCLITKNYAYRGGGLQAENSATINLTGCTISGNSTGYYGSIRAVGSARINLTDCIITGNSANMHAAIVSTQSSVITLTNCTLAGNFATQTYKGVYNDDNGEMVINGGVIKDSMFGDTSAKFTLQGNIALRSTLSVGKLIVIDQNTKLDFTGTDIVGNVITGGTISANLLGHFTVFDSSGGYHYHSGRSVTGGTITSTGHFLPTKTYTYSSSNQTTALSYTEIYGLSGNTSAISITGSSNSISISLVTIDGVTSSAQGAAINITGSNNNVTLNGCRIINNKTLYRTISLPGTCNLTIENCTFDNNQKSGADQATAGWAIGGELNAGYTLIIRNSKFINSEVYGGMLYISGAGTVTVDTMTFVNFRRDYGTLILGGTITGTTVAFPSSAAGFARPVIYHSGELTATSLNSTVRILAGTLFDVSDLTVAGMNATGAYYFISCGPISVGSFNSSNAWVQGGSASMKCVDGVIRTFSGSGNYLSYRGKLMNTVPGAND